MGECLSKNMIKEANFLNFFSDSSQIMLKLGRNPMGRNLVKFKEILMTSSLIRTYDVIITILMSRQFVKISTHSISSPSFIII